VKCVLVWFILWDMSPLPDYSVLAKRDMHTAEACELHRMELQAQYDTGGRWAQSIRRFWVRCEARK
jgi:hypothetical protein